MCFQNQSEILPGSPYDYEIGIEKLEEITGWEFFCGAGSGGIADNGE
ncbi:MAG: hypothetical protein KKG33_05270 [candidate division Zixibacteria bacterium]|nr:hypothetical protein [candidate division Zixibacteria bacterium]